MTKTPSKAGLEICAFNLPGGLAARRGAHRIELCSGPRSSGGLTCISSHLNALSRTLTDIQLHVMVRPREDTFVYSAHDFRNMESTVAHCQSEIRTNGSGRCVADGFVFGILTVDGGVDVERCRVLVELAKRGGQRCTFHRAFDQIQDRKTAIEDVIACGFAGVLTAGGPGSVAQHVAELAETIELAAGRIEVVAGGGVRSSNLEELQRMVGKQPAWWHSAAILDDGDECDPGEVRRLRWILDPESAPRDVEGGEGLKVKA